MLAITYEPALKKNNLQHHINIAIFLFKPAFLRAEKIA